MKDIVAELRKHLDDVQIGFVKSKIMNTLSYDVSCEKIKALGFVPRGSLERGVKDTVELLRGICR